MTNEEAAKLTPAVIEEAMRKRERERKIAGRLAWVDVLRQAGYTGLLPRFGVSN